MNKIVNHAQVKKTNNRKVTLKDNKSSKISLQNPAGLDMFLLELDKCTEIIASKCDHVAHIENKKTIFIELKSRNPSKAVEQMQSSLKHFGKSMSEETIFIVVYKSIPHRTSTTLQNEKARLKKENISFFKIKNGLEYNI